eukprot:7943068-Pyramimonas_sp.AAC.1
MGAPPSAPHRGAHGIIPCSAIRRHMRRPPPMSWQSSETRLKRTRPNSCRVLLPQSPITRHRPQTKLEARYPEYSCPCRRSDR